MLSACATTSGPEEYVMEERNYWDDCEARFNATGVTVTYYGDLTPETPLTECIFWGGRAKTICLSREGMADWIRGIERVRLEGRVPQSDEGLRQQYKDAGCVSGSGLISMTENSLEVLTDQIETNGQKWIRNILLIPGQLFTEYEDPYPTIYWTAYGVYEKIGATPGRTPYTPPHDGYRQEI